jgi:hypothetical protein
MHSQPLDYIDVCDEFHAPNALQKGKRPPVTIG